MFFYLDMAYFVKNEQFRITMQTMHKPMRRRHLDAGFSLIEVMLSVFIFTVGMLALVRLQSFVIQGSRDAQDVDLATNITAAKLEDLMLLDFDLLVAGSEGYNYDGSSGGSYFTTSWTVSGTDLKTVVVTTTWSDRFDSLRRDRRVVLTTNMTNR